ncbi:MAG: hypothetical protein WBA42_01405 [Mesorhizobium sp.]
MEGWLKGLIAAACIAIIAGVGFYFWQQYQEGIAMAEFQRRDTMRRGCYAAIGNNGLSALKEACVEQGYLTQEQANR